MPYIEEWVQPDIFYIHKLGKLCIPVYYTYNDDMYNERIVYWFSFATDAEDKYEEIDIRELPGGHELIKRHEDWDTAARQVLANAINSGYLDDRLPFDKEIIKAARAGTYEPKIEEGACPECGNNRFLAQQVVYMNVIVDTTNDWQENLDSPREETPYGPYTCTICKTKYSNLPSGEGIAG